MTDQQISPFCPVIPGLEDSVLLRNRCYVNGLWIDADQGGCFPVHNPADGSVIVQVPSLGEAEARRAIAEAAAAWRQWRDRTAGERSRLLRRWYGLIQEHREGLARIMTAENGKPLDEARGEVDYGAGFVDWFAAEALRCYGDVIPSPWPDRRIVVLKQPVGVCAAITPWNFPLSMITRKCAAALAAGCTVVVKPAAETPLSALALAELADRAGIPDGVFNVITGPAVVLGRVLTTHPDVRKLSFTGSTEVGRLLYRQSADTLKRISLELGGNAPFIVFEDADLEAAVEGAMQAKFRNAGQTCVSANRIFVQDSLYQVFADRMAERVAALKVGCGFEAGVQQGPLISTEAVAKMAAQIADAVDQGARLVVGGRRHALGGNFFEPTLLTGVRPGMRLMLEETFGPLAPLISFRDEDQVIAMANATDYGLAAYFYTRSLARAFRVSEALEYGMVGVNAGIISTPVAPFGGVKQSGIGREGSKYGIEEYVEIKYLCLNLEED